jgi:hypothetical protein
VEGTGRAKNEPLPLLTFYHMADAPLYRAEIDPGVRFSNSFFLFPPHYAEFFISGQRYLLQLKFSWGRGVSLRYVTTYRKYYSAVLLWNSIHTTERIGDAQTV